MLVTPPPAQLMAREGQPLANLPLVETTTRRPTRQQRKTQPQEERNTKKDQESSEDTNSSSEEVQDIRKRGGDPTQRKDKEAFIQQQLDDLEYTLRSKG